MSALIADIAFGAGGNSDAHVLDGWAEPELAHRWTLGRQSRLRLALDDPGPDCLLVVTATPCLYPPALAAQIVMVAVADRLLATVRIAGLRVMSFRLPAGLRGGELVLSFSHLGCALPRAPEQTRRGQPLGLMVHSVRVFRLAVHEEGTAPRGRPPPPADRAALATRFESLGQGCQFGLMQRWCGAEPLGLLRFVDTTTAMLVEGLASAFDGVDDAAQLELRHTADAEPRLAWRQRRYNLMYDTRLKVADTDAARLRRSQARRLGFLRRKFFEDVAAAQKIFVLTRGNCLTEPEALAVHAALGLHGEATLLWTVFGDPGRAGQVDRLGPGFLRGQLGEVDQHGYGALEVWVGVMRRALALAG
jgi:hypothetical protein